MSDRSTLQACAVVFMAAVIAVGVAASEGTAQNLGQKWKPITEEQTSFRFSAPGLEGTTRRFLISRRDDHAITIEYGVWKSRALQVPKAVIVLRSLAPGYSFTSGLDLKKYIESLNFAKNDSLSIRDADVVVNAIGRVRYRLFSTTENTCVAFGQNFGAYAGVGPYAMGDLDGSDLLFGFYCAAPDQTLDQPDAVKIVKAIEQRQ